MWDTISRTHFLIAAAIVSVVTACTTSPGVLPGGTEAGRTIVGMLDKVEGEDSQGFMEFIAPDFSPDYGELRVDLLTRLQEMEEIEYFVVIDREVSQDSGVYAEFHWQRNWREADGEITHAEGESEWAFRRTEEGLRLIEMRGDDLF